MARSPIPAAQPGRSWVRRLTTHPMHKTPPGSRNTSPVPVNTPVHRASRRQRGLPPEAPEQPTDTVTMTSPQAAMEVPTNSIEWIREIVRSVVREEIQKLYGPRQPEVGSIASVIRDEVQQVLHNRHYQPMPTNVEPAPVSTDIRSRTYAEALRMPVSSLPVASPAVPIQMMPPEKRGRAKCATDEEDRKPPYQTWQIYYHRRDCSARRSLRYGHRPQRQEEPETLWERWWPFAFAMSPPQRDEMAIKETLTESNMDDSSQGSVNEQTHAPDTPAGHYSKAHPYYKKLRLPSGRRVDITRRNYFLRKWRDKKVKTSYQPFIILGSIFLLVCLVIYAYKENMLRDVAQGTTPKKGASQPQEVSIQWRAGTTVDQYEEDTTDDFDTETTDAAENGIGTRGVVFAKDDMKRRLV
ncbi:hypothetical protein HPB52_006742 [Rhipicephalus sanguineus]|uniref:Uncharacterized protein n=1 Tax=Rhipicephalus sanguineus TaxID=34632 RepID=A0A9D4SNJ4_RHISA|nr:hypothetical protein HPB52_006742 [Rhipicephalus sanguineus]